MKILITGANFSNKGAQLMLESLTKAIQLRIPGSTICVSPLLENRDKLRKMGVDILDYPLFHYGHKKVFKPALRYPFIIKQLLKIKGKDTSGNVSLRDIDAVFDISGFAFGDKWGQAPVNDLAAFVKKAKRNKSKFIMFPQAFGPFTKPGMRDDIKEVVSSADLVITRDKQSFSYVSAAAGSDTSNVALFPDITLTFKNESAIEDLELQSAFCAIVPNERMLDKASEGWRRSYIKTMRDMIDWVLQKSDLNVVMLIHAQGDSADAKVGREILKGLDETYKSRLVYYVEEDPVRLKSIIAKSSFLVGSRFHALASALSSNVPAIATSWLHKYEMLFEDYGCESYSFKDPSEELFDRLNDLIDSQTNDDLKQRLREINVHLSERNEQMWKRINDVLKG